MRIAKNRWILEMTEATIGKRMEIERHGRRVVFIQYLDTPSGKRVPVVRLHPLEALHILRTLGLVYV